MSGFPDNAVDFILADPPYLVGFRDRQGRTIAGDKTDEWLQPACHEMYRLLKKDALLISFYGWNCVDRFMAAWKQAGFIVVGHLVFPKFASMHCLWRRTTKFLSWMPSLRAKEKNMYGTCETLCRLLREQYPAETPLNLIVWSPADIEALADGKWNMLFLNRTSKRYWRVWAP